MTKDRSARRSRLCIAATGVIALISVLGAAAEAKAAGSSNAQSTIGLVLTGWRYGLVETQDAKAECADGLQPGEIAQFKATPGAYQQIRTLGGTFETRGPNSETGNFSPDVVIDPLPFRELSATTAFGFNLDGTEDGRATPKTRQHVKFTNAEGVKVDNQMARVVGCVLAYRTGGIISEYQNNDISNHPINRLLIEINSVDDEVNDPAVEVVIYKGLDRLLRKSDGSFIPMLSQRIDVRYPRYTQRLKGKIVDGVLVTQALDRAVLPYLSMADPGERDMRDLTLRLKLNADGAEGMLGGYENWRKWYTLHSKKLISGPGNYSSPSIFRALQRYADGYPDPATGEFGYISTAYKITAVRAAIVHPTVDTKRVATR